MKTTHRPMNPIPSKWSRCYLSSPRARVRLFALFPLAPLALYLVVLAVLAACSPAQRSAEEKAIDTATKAIGPVCVIIRAVSADATVKEICATAEELAPFVDALIQSRLGAPPEPRPVTVAAALEAPKSYKPSRHCERWTYETADAGALASFFARYQDGGGPEGGRRDETHGDRTGPGFAVGASGRDAGTAGIDGGEPRGNGSK